MICTSEWGGGLVNMAAGARCIVLVTENFLTWRHWVAVEAGNVVSDVWSEAMRDVKGRNCGVVSVDELPIWDWKERACADASTWRPDSERIAPMCDVGIRLATLCIFRCRWVASCGALRGGGSVVRKRLIKSKLGFSKAQELNHNTASYMYTPWWQQLP